MKWIKNVLPMSSYSAEQLIDMGYRRVSNSARHISRVDREDWKEYMALQSSRSLKEGLEWVNGMDCPEDHYRRVYAKDVITVPASIYDKIPSSCWDKTGYIPISES